MERLRAGEILTLLNSEGEPEDIILMDSFDGIRVSPIENQMAILSFMMFGVPIPYYASPDFRKQFEEKLCSLAQD